MKATVDRIEGDLAVVILAGAANQRLTLPVTCLPADTREGDVLTLTLEHDRDATRSVKDRSALLIEKLRQK